LVLDADMSYFYTTRTASFALQELSGGLEGDMFPRLRRLRLRCFPKRLSEKAFGILSWRSWKGRIQNVCEQRGIEFDIDFIDKTDLSS
jgi:hypothetical protein